MKVHLKYFASVREAMGSSGETLETVATTIADLRAQLVARGAQTLARPSVRAALNRVMCTDDVALSEGCEVAFFPPVTGG